MANTALVFAWAVWLAVCSARSLPPSPDSPSFAPAIASLVRSVVTKSLPSLSGFFSGVRADEELGDADPNNLRALRATRLGPASSRTAELNGRARTAFNTLIKRLDPLSIICYTDGAALGNPGPSGAGALIQLPSHPDIELWEALGDGTNNFGEVWAVGLVLEKLLALRAAGVARDSRKAYICTDSSLTEGLLFKNWSTSSPSLRAVVTAVRKLLREVRATFLVSPIWCPGHAGIHGNEEADRLAGLGSTLSKEGGGIPSPLVYLLDSGFSSRK